MDERAWVEAHREVVAEAYRLRAASGEWPKVGKVDRWAVQQGLAVDVAAIANSVPELPGLARPYYAEYLMVPLRLLRFLPEAAAMTAICLGITQVAVSRYRDSEVENPQVSSEDPDVAALSSDKSLIELAGQILSSMAYGPIGGGSYGNGTWTFGVDERWIKIYLDVNSVHTLFDRQAQAAEAFAANRPGRVAVQSVLADPVDLVITPPSADEPGDGADGYLYDVALSFAGEDRALVEVIAQQLKAIGISYFYDGDNQALMWGEELTELLDRVYRVESRYTVIFASIHYARKTWTRYERRSALSRAVTERGPYILPIRLDDTELDGIRPSVGYLDAREIGTDGIVQMIREKLSNEGPSVDAVVTRVPRTPNEMHVVRQSRPAGWEYLLFIGALLHGKNSLEEKHRDHLLRYGTPNGRYVSDAEIGDYCREQFSYCSTLVETMAALMNERTQLLAFGAAGEPGDPDMIMQLAQRLTEHYDRFLEWARNIRGVAVDSDYRDLMTRLAAFADQPITAYRAFIDRAVEQADQIPEFMKKRKEGDEPLMVDLVYKVEVPPAVSQAFTEEIDRLKER